MTNYCILSNVVGDYGVSGLETTDINATLIANAIASASAEIDRLTGNPLEIDYERHIADGMREVFDLDNQNGVQTIDRVVYNGILSMQPYPEDGSWAENNSSSWTATSLTLSDESTTIKDKDYSLKAIVAGGATGVMSYPTTQNLRFIYDQYTYFCFWINADVTTKTFTVTLYRDGTNYLQKTFTVSQSGVWELIGIQIGDITETGDVGNTDRGIDKELNYFEISVPGEITFYIDGIVFADKYVPVLDAGQIAWPNPETRPSKGTIFEVSYTVDLFDTIPDDLKMAAAHLAAATAWEWYGGQRYRQTGGVFRLDTGTGKSERFFGFESVVKRLRRMGLEKLNLYLQGPEIAWTEESDHYGD